MLTKSKIADFITLIDSRLVYSNTVPWIIEVMVQEATAHQNEQNISGNGPDFEGSEASSFGSRSCSSFVECSCHPSGICSYGTIRGEQHRCLARGYGKQKLRMILYTTADYSNTGQLSFAATMNS